LELADEGTIDETLVERRYRFLSQRNAGGTFRAIAERHNDAAVKAATAAGRPVGEAKTVSPATVRKDVERAKHDIISESTRESLIAEQRSVLLDVRRVHYAGMVAGDPDATKMVLNTVVQMREMFGLDAPKRSVVGIGTDVEFARDLANLFDQVGLEAPPDLIFAARGESMPLDVEVVDDDTVAEDAFDQPLDVSTSTPSIGDDETWSNL
jgi:hypothetical protein